MPAKQRYIDPDAALESGDRLDEVLAGKGLSAETWWRRKNPLTEEEAAYVDEPLQRAQPCFVYFVQDGEDGPIKIGHAADVDKRLAALQTAHHNTLRPLLVVPGGAAAERAMHRKFWRSRIRGEWFKPTPMLMAFISEKQ